MKKAVNEGQTQVYTNSEIIPQRGINTNAPHLNQVPQQLIDITTEFFKSGKSDAQVLAILVGMGIPQQLALSGIDFCKTLSDQQYNENNNKQKNHKTMNFTLSELYENVVKSIDGLKEMDSDNSRVSYSVKSALGILEGTLTTFPMRFKNEDASVISEEVENSVNPTLKFKIAKSLHRDLSSSDWLNPVRELRSYISETYNGSKWSFRIAEAAENNSNGKGKLFENLSTELETLLKESGEIKTKFSAIAAKNPWSHEMKSILNEMKAEDQKAISNNGGTVSTLLSPVLESENGLTFHLHGKNYNFNGKEITETTVNDSRFFDVLEGLKTFSNSNGTLVTFGENGKTLEYNLTEGTLSLGNIDLSNASIIELKESLIASNFFGYRDQWKVDKVCRFFESIDMLAEMDNFTNVQSADFLKLFLTVISVEEGVWVNKVNGGMQLNEMKFYPSATEAVKVIKEFINYDATNILSEKLIAEGNEKAALDKTRSAINDKISFLQEKKETITAALKKVGESDELKEALSLIESEIVKFEKELQSTFAISEKKTRDQYLDDGYVEAKLNTSIAGFKKGYEVLVNAEEYSSLGNDDLLNVIDPKTDKSKIIRKDALNVEI